MSYNTSPDDKAVCSVFPYLEEDLLALKTKLAELKDDGLKQYVQDASAKLLSRRTVHARFVVLRTFLKPEFIDRDSGPL